MTQRVAAIGECMIEMAPTDVPGTYGMNFAGDTFNTAWYLRRRLPADWTVDYVTAIGSDSASQRMHGFFGASGIGTGHVWRHPDRTVGLYLIELEGAERHFSYWRGQSAARTLADDPARLADALRGAALVYFSGITLAILEPLARAALLDAVASARAGGATVAFDPNLRPRLWAAPAEMCAAVMDAAAVSDIVLPSFDDEAAWFGDAGPQATAARYAGRGAGTVAVKNGPGEILTLDGGRTATHPALRVEAPVDTTAAGDSFNAGFLAARAGQADIGASVAAGCALAGKVICSRGALVAVD